VRLVPKALQSFERIKFSIFIGDLFQYRKLAPSCLFQKATELQTGHWQSQWRPALPTTPSAFMV
jgi:hypothetical protein